MKTTLMHISSQIRPHNLLMQVLLFAAAVTITGGVLSAEAQTAIDKSSSYTSLATPADWTGSVVPGANNTSVWDTGAGTPSLEPLGADLTWDGVQILNPLGAIIISADGNTLTNGVAGINMLQAGQSLTMSNNVELNGPQSWQVGNNQTLSLQGGLYRRLGSELFFSFDNSASAAAFIQTNIAGSVVAANTMVMMDGTIGNGTSTGLPLGTYNDVDFAALDQQNQVVPGASIAYTNLFGTEPIYLGNPNGPTPTAASGTAALFYDFTNTTSYGIRISTTTYVLGMRFNNPQTNTAYTYGGFNAIVGGIPAWQVLFKSGNVLDPNAILVTTNVGNSPVVFTSGGSARISVGVNEMAIFQNNPAAPLVFQSPITQRTASYVDKYGAGTLELQAACSYSVGTLIYGGTVLVDGAGTVGVGPVSVFSGGNFEGEGGAADSAPVTVSSGGTNSVLINTANGQFKNNTNLIFSAGTTCLQFIYSNGIAPSATTAPLLITTAGASLTLNNTVNVNVMGGNFSVGQYPLVKYASLAGTGFAALNLNALPPDVFGYLSNNVNNSSIDLVITAVGQPVVWNSGSGVWDIGQTANWLDGFGNGTNYQQVLSSGENVVFNDTASGPLITVTLNTNPTPASVTFNDSVNSYTVSGTGSINGPGTLTKSGTGSLTLGTINSFSGGININGGVVTFSALPNLGTGAINFNGGTLQYNGNTDDISSRVVTFNAGGATIDVGSQNVAYVNPIGSGGSGGLTKVGSGTLTINGTNTFTGSTVVSQGTLELGTNTFIAKSSVINVTSGAVLDTAVSGVNLALSAGQTLTGSGQVNGIVTNSALSIIAPAGAGLTGTLSINGGLSINAQSDVNLDVAPTSNDVIAVTGNLNIAVDSTLNINVIGTLPVGRYVIMTYTGNLTGAGANMAIFSNNSGTTVLSLDSSVQGQIALVVTAGARDVLLWPGTGTSWDEAGTLDWLNGGTSWSYTNGDTVMINDAETGGNTTIQVMTNVQPSVVIVSNTVVPTYTFADGSGSGNGLITGSAALVKQGSGTLVVQTADNYTGPTTISGGTLQIGNGGIGEVGFGNVTNNGALIFQEGDGATHFVAGVVSGTGSLTVNVTGSSVVTLTGNNTYTGPTTIGSGTLQVGDSLASGTLGGTSAVTNNGILMLDRAGTYTLAPAITGSGALDDEGSAIISLGANPLTYQGDTSISNGTVKLGANNQLPNQGSVAGSVGILNLDGGLSSAGTLDLNGFNATVNDLSGLASTVNGTLTDSSTATPTNTLTILTTANTTYNGQITGAKLKLVVMGPATNVNTLTLNPSAVDTFSGGMVISNSFVYLGSDANLNSSEMAPGFGPITLLGTNTILVTDGGQSGAPNSSTYAALTNSVIVPAGQVATIYGPCRGAFGSTVTGGGILNYDTTYVRDTVSGNWSGFTGQVVLTGNSTGGNVGFSVANALANASVLMTTDVALYCESGGTVCSIGALSGGDQSCQLEGLTTGGANSGAQNTTFQIGGLNTSTIYTGGIIDTNNLLKVGTGTLTLNCGGVLTTNVVPDTNTGFNITVIGYGANRVSYTGNTTISNGVLALVAPVALINSTNVTIASPAAELDASEMGFISNLTTVLPNGATQEVVIDSTFEIITNQTLGGIGTLNGNVQADQGSTLAVGLPTGVFNVTSNASLSGLIQMNLDDTNKAGCSELSAPSFTINSTATLVVTNIGPNLTNGVTFTLFNNPVTGIASITLPATDPTGTSPYTWQTNLSVNGSITLVSGGVSTIPNIPPHITFSVSGPNLTLSWPPPYLGEVLQAQTNAVTKGLSTNWVNVTGSGSVTNMTFTINPVNGTVFYRLAP
ncbi:MAG TPA: autotransporter-associated beta strand repeat-containing protein [Verrucomicrobiae bacterium]|nr:autotransporter-associated beta strand repeat-containing protein [Verrucomicrobiae bacterium]